jgi:hypothetical protein
VSIIDAIVYLLRNPVVGLHVDVLRPQPASLKVVAVEASSVCLRYAGPNAPPGLMLVPRQDGSVSTLEPESGRVQSGNLFEIVRAQLPWLAGDVGEG